MKCIEKSAKTVEEAINLALDDLNLTIEEVNVEVLEEPSKGFLGILGVKNALVRVEEIYNPVKEVKLFLNKVFKFFKLDPQMEVVNNENSIMINITGDDLGILIGRRGDTLDALQFLLNLIINKNFEKRIKVYLDIEDYRKKRENTLNNLALRLADKVKRTGRKVVLEPMNPHERRIIHIALQEEKGITTYSEGEEPYRKVVIVPKYSRNYNQ